MPKTGMTASTGLLGQFEIHPLGLVESADQVSKSIASGEKLDRASLGQTRSSMAIDASKRRILPFLHPAAAVYTGEILRGNTIEALSDFEMQRRIVGMVARVAEIVLPFESIASDHADATEQKEDRPE